MNRWLDHQGHKIVVSHYQDATGKIINISIECEDCWEVLTDEEEASV